MGASTTSSYNFEKKMEQIKTQKVKEKKNDFDININQVPGHVKLSFYNSDNNKENKIKNSKYSRVNNKINNNVRVNKFFTTYHKANKNEEKIKNIKEYNNRGNSPSFAFNDGDINNNLYNNNIKYHKYVKSENLQTYSNNYNNLNRAFSDNKYTNNDYSQNNILNNRNYYYGYNNKNYFYQIENNNKINFQNSPNLNVFYGNNINNNENMNNLNSLKKNLFNNNLRYDYNPINSFYNTHNKDNNQIINININYNPIYYNIINNNSKQHSPRKEMRTPEINKMRLKEKMINNLNNNRNNLDNYFFSNDINEFVEGEKNKKEIPKFNNIRIINGNYQ